MKPLWFGLGLVAAALLGALLAPPLEPSATAPAAPRPDDWQDPQLPRKPDLGGQALALAGSPLFEPEATTAALQAAAAAPPPDERWRIAGLLGRGEARVVLVSFMDPARSQQTLKPGDRLPSGHRIERIEADAVCVQVGRKILRIGVQTRD